MLSALKMLLPPTDVWVHLKYDFPFCRALKCVFNSGKITFDYCPTAQHCHINHKKQHEQRKNPEPQRFGWRERKSNSERLRFWSNCSLIEVLPSPRLSNKVWSPFLSIPQNLLMRPNPFNSCPNCQSYGYNCVCVCQFACVFEQTSSEHFSPAVRAKREEQQFPLEEKLHQRHQKTKKTWCISIRPNECPLRSTSLWTLASNPNILT